MKVDRVRRREVQEMANLGVGLLLHAWTTRQGEQEGNTSDGPAVGTVACCP